MAEGKTVGGEIQEGSNKQAQQRIQDNHAIPHRCKLVPILPHGFDKDKGDLYNRTGYDGLQERALPAPMA
jgi:hypothetical protein